MKVVGLTGGIACGKSAVAEMFAAAGIAVVDADVVARRVVAPGTEAFRAIVDLMGEGVLASDGGLDRRAVGDLAFRDAAARRALEDITHPEIRAASLEDLRALESAGHAMAVYEAALLIEKGRHREMDALVVVTAPEATQRERLVRRDGEQALGRLSAQMPAGEKALFADFVIDNGGGMSETERQVQGVIRLLKERFQIH